MGGISGRLFDERRVRAHRGAIAPDAAEHAAVVRVVAIAQPDDGGVLQLLQDTGLAEHVGHLAVEVVSAQRLDNDAAAGVAVAAQEGDAEAAGPEEALRLELGQRERREPGRVQLGGAEQGRQRRRAVAALQRGDHIDCDTEARLITDLTEAAERQMARIRRGLGQSIILSCLGLGLAALGYVIEKI